MKARKRQAKPGTSWRGAARLFILRHDRDKSGDFAIRVLMHIPVGLVTGIPILGYPVLKLFIFYEENEDLHIKDEAWKDTFGALIGATLTVLAVTSVIIWALFFH
jgi:hypothetical protein